MESGLGDSSHAGTAQLNTIPAQIRRERAQICRVLNYMMKRNNRSPYILTWHQMKHDNDSRKIKRGRRSTQCVILLSLPQGHQNAQIYTGSKSDWSNLWQKKKKSLHIQKIHQCLFDSKLPKKQVTAQGGDRQAGKELFSTCFACKYLTVNPSYGLSCSSLRNRKNRVRAKRCLGLGSLQSAGCLSEGDTRDGQGFGCTGRVKAGSSGCSWGGSFCLELG